MNVQSVTFDSNAWESVFDPENERWTALRDTMFRHGIASAICDKTIAIESIRKNEREKYYQKPKTQFCSKVVGEGGKLDLQISFGPQDDAHPGIPIEQLRKLKFAILCGVRLIRGMNWLGLPVPSEFDDPTIYLSEVDWGPREIRQAWIFDELSQRTVGKNQFDKLGGWAMWKTAQSASTKSQISRACAEWADAELVSAHVAYGLDAICTSDRGGRSRNSVFSDANRAWLSEQYSVKFLTPEELWEALR